MKITKIGLFTRLYEFKLNEHTKYNEYIKKLQSKGEICERFINNKYAFEFTAYKKM